MYVLRLSYSSTGHELILQLIKQYKRIDAFVVGMYNNKKCDWTQIWHNFR